MHETFVKEATKPGLVNTDSITASGHVDTLVKCLDVSLRTIAPIAPFLADELYAQLSQRIPLLTPMRSLMEAPYPKTEEVPKIYFASRSKHIVMKKNCSFRNSET